MKCIGFGVVEDTCSEEAASRGVYCPGCGEDRRDTIARRFEMAGALFAADVARTAATAP